MRDQTVEQRMGKVRLLLSSLDDYVPTVKAANLGNESGPAPSRRVPCDCHDGRIRFRLDGVVMTRLCLVCDGTGWRKRDRLEPAWDEYIEQPVEEAVEPQLFSGTDHAAEVRRLDASIRKIQQTLRAKAGVLDKRERFGWEAAREHQERFGSYVELRYQLGRLRERWPDGWRAIHRVHLANIEVMLCEVDRVHEDLGVYWLQHEMRTLRVPPWLMEYEGARRRESVKDLAGRGMLPGAIARRTGIPKRKVRRILRAVAA